MAERRILIVDDEADVRFPLGRFLRGQGLRGHRGRGPRRGSGDPAPPDGGRRGRGFFPGRRRRPRGAGDLEGPGRVPARRAPHRPRDHRSRGEGHQGRSRAVLHQAGRAAGAPGGHRARSRKPEDAAGIAGGQDRPGPPGRRPLLRRERGHPQAGGRGGESGRFSDTRAHPGRDGQRQGGPGPMAPPGEPPRRRALRGPELRGPQPRAPGDGAVRPREGCVHGGGRGQARPAGGGAPRHPLPRRDRRRGPPGAGQAAQGGGGAALPPIGRRPRPPGGRAPPRRHPPRSRPARPRAEVPRGPLLPHQRPPRRGASSAANGGRT